jgi:uncharacterized protein involved in exopolysaccharide biosynthesis
MKQSEIDIKKVLLVFRARARFIATMFIAAVAIAAIVTYLSPKLYRAASTLNFEFTTNPVDTRGRVLSDQSYLSTQIDIIKSLSVAREVENSLSDYEKARLKSALDAEFSIIDKYKQKVKSTVKAMFSNREHSAATDNSGANTLEINSAYTSLTRRMGGGLDVVPMINSRVVEISYMSTDRKIAALMANRYAEAYITASVKMITDPAQKSKVWFDAQLKSLRDRLEDAQAMLTAYQQQEGIVSSAGRLNIESARLEDLASQLVIAQQTTRNAVSEKRKLQEVTERGASLMTFGTVFDNPVVQNISSEIRKLKGNIAEKSTTLGRNHPDMKKLSSELYSAEQRLESEINTIIDNINNAAELSSEREIELDEALKEQKAIVLELKNKHDKIAVLERELESAQTTYNAALDQLNTTSMQSMIDQTNVSIIDGANIPSRHTKPKVMINLALGAFGGLLLGFGLALFMELLTRRVHTNEELIDELGIPLLGHLKNV